MKENTRFYKVICMCGHVGRNNYIPIPFAIQAKDGKEASKIARKRPRVKHDRKDAILSCTELSQEQYQELLCLNYNDPYLRCQNIQEQREHPEIQSRVCKLKTAKERHRKSEKMLSRRYKEWKYEKRYEKINLNLEFEHWCNMDTEGIVMEDLI